MNDWQNLFTGDLVFSRLTPAGLFKALDRLERMGFQFDCQSDPEGRLILHCTASPLDVTLAQMKEFRCD